MTAATIASFAGAVYRFLGRAARIVAFPSPVSKSKPLLSLTSMNMIVIALRPITTIDRAIRRERRMV